MAEQSFVILSIEPEDVKARDSAWFSGARVVDEQTGVAEYRPGCEEGGCGEKPLFEVGEGGEVEKGEGAREVRWDLVFVVVEHGA